MNTLLGSALKPSPSQLQFAPKLPPTVLASGHEGVSRVRARWDIIRLKHSASGLERICRLESQALNHAERSEEYPASVLPYQSQKTTQFVARVASKYHDQEHDSGIIHREMRGESIRNLLHAIYRYMKPYTLIATVFSVVAISFVSIQKLSDFTPSFWRAALQVVTAATLANSYVVGINQLSDIEIDKVNKPHLPLVSGEISTDIGVLLTSLYAVLGFLLGWSINSWPLRLGLLLWFAFGTAYSVDMPLLRWKKDPVLAASCVWSVQGLIIPILFHLHVQTNAFGRPPLLSKHVLFVAAFMSVYSIVFSLFKDIPDVEGDKINGIQSLAVQIGKKRVFWICIWLLEIAYIVAALAGLTSPYPWVRALKVLSHGILGLTLWKKANSVDLEKNEAVESLYLFIWKLYFAEYVLVPILRI